MRFLSAVVFIAIIFESCTVPRRGTGGGAIVPSDGGALPKVTNQPENRSVDSTQPGQLPPGPPPRIPPAQWKGLGFAVLPKQGFVKQYGYELYACPPAACSSVKVDTAWELGTRRIRCDRLAGEYLFVESVTQTGDEWMVAFNHPKSGRSVYATTREHAIAEIAPAADIDSARKRWLGSAVFARRGVISTLGTNPGASIGSLRVDIRDSLMVTDVRWGVTPLPVKPLWLMVTCAHTGKTGFIPIRYSWTNTMQRQVRPALPWEEDIFETDPARRYRWDEAIWEVVNNHRVVLDMTEEQVRVSWGEPVSSGKVIVGETEQAVWTYPSQRLSFSAGRLASIEELPAGAAK